MNPREIIKNTVNHQQPESVPYTLSFEGDVEQRITQHYGVEQWKSSLKKYFVSVGAVDTDMRTELPDGLSLDAYGGIWRMDRRPWHLVKPPLTEPTFDGYTFPEPEKFFRPEWKKQAQQTCKENSQYFLIGNISWGIFERSWNLRGFENILMDSVSNPVFFEEVLDRLTDLYLAFVEYTADLPVDGIFFGDDWGDQRSVILGPERWRKFLKPRWAKIYDAVHQHGKIVIHHSCGSVADIMPDLIEIGMDVLESVQPEARGMNPYSLKRQWGSEITFWGGLGSQSTIPFGTPAEIHAEVNKLKQEMGKDGGYILAPAKSLQPETPTLNAVAVVEAFRG